MLSYATTHAVWFPLLRARARVAHGYAAARRICRRRLSAAHYFAIRTGGTEITSNDRRVIGTRAFVHTKAPPSSIRAPHKPLVKWFGERSGFCRKSNTEYIKLIDSASKMYAVLCYALPDGSLPINSGQTTPPLSLPYTTRKHVRSNRFRRAPAQR